jgi:hypothetical protein
MKRNTLMLFALLMLVGGAWAQPENITVEWHHWSSQPACELLESITPCAPSEGVWVAVFVRDPDVRALSITLNYRDESGRELTRTSLVPRWYRLRPNWTNELFLVGRVKVRSILVVPLVSSLQTVLLTASDVA